MTQLSSMQDQLMLQSPPPGQTSSWAADLCMMAAHEGTKITEPTGNYLFPLALAFKMCSCHAQMGLSWAPSTTQGMGSGPAVYSSNRRILSA